MGTRAVFVLLTFLVLIACAPQGEALRAEANEQRCKEIATTGDLFRECLIVGPEQTTARAHPG